MEADCKNWRYSEALTVLFGAGRCLTTVVADSSPAHPVLHHKFQFRPLILHTLSQDVSWQETVDAPGQL